MRTALALIAAVVLAAPPARASQATDLSAERVVFHTAAGDLVFALYPNAAPQTVQQFLKLTRAGVYDGVSFGRIHPGFIAQVSSAQARTTPLTPEQSALLHKLPLEASSPKHVRGSLSLAHPDDDPNGGEFSFCIMLAPAPHLDGKYTVFGELIAGDGVLAELLDVPRNAQLAPTTRIGIDRVEVYDSAEALTHAYVVPAHPVATANRAATVAPREDSFVIAGLLAVALLAALGGLFRDRLPARVTRAMSLATLLVCAFLLLMLLAPDGQHRPWLATTLFFGLILVFKALGKFEQPAGSA